MRAVVQRTSEASVHVKGEEVGRIGRGLVALVGVGHEDGEADVRYVADKIVGLRIFADEADKMNLSVQDVGGDVLVISQFTLLGDCRKGRRPSFVGAAQPEFAEDLYERVAERIREHGVAVATGRFGAMMDVMLVNDGPVTLLLDSTKTL